MPPTSKAVPEALTRFDSLPDSAHVRLPVVAGLLDVSQATVWRYVQLGHLPAPHKFGARVSAWNVGQLREALKAR
jgi:predicted DNA-binding transcriptional regulator AlpA